MELERLFDRRDAFLAQNSSPNDDVNSDFEKVNLRDTHDPKLINLGTCCGEEEKAKLVKLLAEYIDVFAWSYEDLKTFCGGRYKHHITLKPSTSPSRQKLRTYNPKVSNAIFKEIDKMLKAHIIFPIHHSTWVENIVPVRKKNGEIRICVDFRNLNQASLKDNFALPIMDQILQIVAGSEMMSFLDGFSGYNQIEVTEEDRHKTAFTTPWGTFAYRRMPFGLINAGATFQ